MKWIPGGTFSMGSSDFYPEERPVHRAEVSGFWIDEHPVTNAQFVRFVAETDYVTVAERTPDPADYPEVDPAKLVAGALVFRPAGPADGEHVAGPVPVADPRARRLCRHIAHRWVDGV